MADEHLDYEAADAFVKGPDKQLIKWTRFLYGVEWLDASLYDVVVNLERVSVEGAVETLVHMTRLDGFRPTEESRKAFADLLLSSTVWAALATNARTRSANVRVAADDGAVFVTGPADNERTVAAVCEVDGVGQVNSEVAVGRNWQW